MDQSAFEIIEKFLASLADMPLAVVVQVSKELDDMNVLEEVIRMVDE